MSTAFRHRVRVRYGERDFQGVAALAPYLAHPMVAGDAG